MDIKNTPIWEEIETIFASGSNDVHFRYSCEIDVGGEIIIPMKLEHLKVIRRYSDQFSDYMYLDLLIPSGTYSNKLFPNRDNIKITVFKEPLAEVNAEHDLETDILTRTYRASLINAKSDRIEGSTPITNDEERQNNESQDTYTFQLIDLAAEQFEMSYCGRNYPDMLPHEVIEGLITLNGSYLKLDDSSTLKGADVIVGDNTTVRANNIIPSGTKVSSIPDYVQEHCGGVYNTGMGQYIQNGIWYVYPQFNTERFEKTSKTVTFFNIPERTLPDVERTYKFEDGKLVIVVTGRTVQVDNSERKQLTDGGGVHYARGGAFVDSFVAVADKKAMVSAKDNMVEYVIEDRVTKVNNVPMSSERITSNHPNEMSKLAEGLGQMLMVTWQHADPDLIYPGMPCKYVYISDDVIEEIYGVVLGLEFDVALQGNGLSNTRHTTTSNVYLFVERK